MKIKPVFLCILLFITISLIYCIPFYAHASVTQKMWIQSLSQCESGGKPDITVLDTNNKYSYGELQFQLATFMTFGKQYGILPEELSIEEGRLLIHNSYIQKGIAKAMLDDGLWYHWYNCTKMIGPYPI